MCCQYYIDKDIYEDMLSLAALPDESLRACKPQGDIHPSDLAPILLGASPTSTAGCGNSIAMSQTSNTSFGSDLTMPQARDQILIAGAMKWGFIGMDGDSLLINARSESALAKRTFADSVHLRRCAIPARHFYEWDKEKNKNTFQHEDHSVLYLAGFYNYFDQEKLVPGKGKKVIHENRFIILTTNANSCMEKVHDRMPLILGADEVSDWILRDDLTAFYLGKESPLLRRIPEYEQLSLFS